MAKFVLTLLIALTTITPQIAGSLNRGSQITPEWGSRGGLIPGPNPRSAARCTSCPRTALSFRRQQRFRAGVDVLHMQVGVANAAGDFVSGLRAEDFRLTVDGEPRRIVSVWEVDADEPPPIGPYGDEASTAEALTDGPEITEVRGAPGAMRRRFLLFVDLARLSRPGLLNTRRTASEFLSEIVRPPDLVGIATYSPRRGLQYMVPFTTRHDLVAGAIEQLTLARSTERLAEVGEGIPIDDILELYSGIGDEAEGIDEFLREIEEMRIESSAQLLVDALRELARTLEGVEGRKNVLMFSHGLPDQLLAEGAIASEFNRFSAAARRADVVLHTLDPSNVPVSDVHDVTNQVSTWQPGSVRGNWESPSTMVLGDRSVLHLLARETGGTASFWRRGVRQGLREVERSTNQYYVVAFPLEEADPDALSVEITTVVPEVLITWAPVELRVGRADRQLTELERTFDVAEALEISANRNALDARVEAWMLPESLRESGARVAIAVEIDVEEMFSSSGAGEAPSFELLGLAVTHDRRILDYFRGRASRPTSTEGSEASGLGPLRFASWLQVPPGRHYVKVIVRESRSGRLFSRSYAVAVPVEQVAALRVQSPIVVLPGATNPMLRGTPRSAAVPQENEVPPAHFSINGLALTLDLSRELRPGGDAALLVTVLGVTPDPRSGSPSVSMAAEFVDKGEDAAEPQLSVISADWDAVARVLRVLVRLELGFGWPAGEYDLLFRASDNTVQASAEATTRVTISR